MGVGSGLYICRRKTFAFAISASDEFLLHLALPFISSLQVIVDISNLVCVLNIPSPMQLTDDKLSLKGAWSLSRDLFHF